MNAISSRYLNQSIFNAKYHDGAPGGRDQSPIDVRLKLTSTQPAVRMVTTTTRVPDNNNGKNDHDSSEGLLDPSKTLTALMVQAGFTDV